MIVLFEIFAIVAVIVAAIKEPELIEFENRIYRMWKDDAK